MSFTPRTSRFNGFAFHRVAVILALLAAGFGLAYATVPVAGVSSGTMLSPTGHVDMVDARSLPNVPPVSENITAPGLNDAAITFVCCSYNPTVVTITVGASVSWSGSFSFHPLRQVDGPTSDVPVPGGFANSTGTFYSVQFNTPGTFYYQCAIHGLAQFGGTMRGQIIVLRPPMFLPLVMK